MGKQRNQYNAEFKFRVALEAAKGTKTVSQVASEYGVHPSQVSDWKGQLMVAGVEVFNRAPGRPPREAAKTEAELYEQIGHLKMELEWLKKRWSGSVAAKRALIEPDHPTISVRRQCELLELNRASYYYTLATESALNLVLMRCIDEQYLKTPFYGWPRMTAYLRSLGYAVNHKRVQRLLQVIRADWQRIFTLIPTVLH